MLIINKLLIKTICEKYLKSNVDNFSVGGRPWYIFTHIRKMNGTKTKKMRKYYVIKTIWLIKQRHHWNICIVRLSNVKSQLLVPAVRSPPRLFHQLITACIINNVIKFIEKLSFFCSNYVCHLFLKQTWQIGNHGLLLFCRYFFRFESRRLTVWFASYGVNNSTRRRPHRGAINDMIAGGKKIIAFSISGLFKAQH